jgi:hypothetical protein
LGGKSTIDNQDDFYNPDFQFPQSSFPFPENVKTHWLLIFEIRFNG